MTAYELAAELTKLWKDADLIVYDPEADRVRDIEIHPMPFGLVWHIKEKTDDLAITTWTVTSTDTDDSYGPPTRKP